MSRAKMLGFRKKILVGISFKGLAFLPEVAILEA